MITGPSAEHADAALAFVFDAWASLPADGLDPDPADLALAEAFRAWREAKGMLPDTPPAPSIDEEADHG